MTIHAAQEGNGAQDVDALEATAAVEAGGQSLEAGGSGEREVAEEPSGDSDPGGDVAALKAEVAELKRALTAKASLEETQALEATVDSLKNRFSENGAKEHREGEGSAAHAQKALGDLEARMTTLRADLDTLGRATRASRAEEQVAPNTVPPIVLQQVYEETLTEIFQEMTRLSGAGAPRRTREIMETIRRSSSGMEFFRVADDKKIVATGLAVAIQRRLLSAAQVHLTFSQFHRRLLAEVPRYRARRFEDLVGARTSAFSVATIRRLADQTGDLGEKLNGIVRRLDTLEGLAGRLDTLEANVKGVTTAP